VPFPLISYEFLEEENHFSLSLPLTFPGISGILEVLMVDPLPRLGAGLGGGHVHM
jgi:hypothetical protein